MSDRKPTHADTAWGLVCAAIHARLLATFPRLSLGIGPDGASLHKAPPACTFERVGPAQTVPGLRGAIYDRVIPIRVTLWMADPVEAEQAWLRFLIALNALAHVRASRPAQDEVRGGAVGESGCKETGTFTLRLAVVDEPARAAVPTAVALNPIALTTPADVEIETVTLGA